MHARVLTVLSFAATALFATDLLAAPPEGDAGVSTSGSATASGTRTGVRSIRGASGKRFRLHADTESFGFSIFDPDGPGDAIGAAGFGVARPNTVDGGRFGVGQIQQTPSYGLGFAYLFAQERALVGARASFIVNGTFDEAPDAELDQSTTTVGGYLVPYFQWMFLPGNWARPYVEARLGFGGGATRARSQGGGMENEVTLHTISPNVGVGGGAHLFILESFSIDLGLNIDYFAPHSRLTGDVPDDAEDWEEIGDLVTIGTVVGFSVWFR